jgi:serine phosphatase RsbU (regulator of sigma subunit)
MPDSRPSRARHRAPYCSRGVRGNTVVVVLCAAAMTCAASAAVAVEYPTEDPIVLSGDLHDRTQIIFGWRYHPGDDPAWADPDFDDSGWPVMSSLLPDDDPPPGGWPGIGWFRRRVRLGDGMPPTALAIRVEHFGASEVYLDGRLMIRNGTVSPDPAVEHPVYSNDFDGIALEPGQTHVLAVRFSNARGNLHWKNNRGFWVNMRSVVSAAGAYHRFDRIVMLRSLAFGGAFAALAMLHLLLYAFHPASREHLFFAVFAATVAASLVLWTAWDLETDFLARLWIYRWYTAARVAMVLSALVLIHVMFRRRPAWTTWVVSAAGVAYVAWVWSWDALRTGVVGDLFYAVAFLEMARVSVAAVLRRERDAWIVAAAFLPLALVSATGFVSRLLVWKLDVGYLPTATLAMVALAFSVFISRQAGRTARELERKIDEIRALSDHALEQERRAIHEEAERRLLEAEKQRRTEELEAARRLQLAMLPHVAPEIAGFDLEYRMVTATEVGGDYVDLRLGDDGRALLAVGDATSHGLQAGMVVAVAKSLFQSVDPQEPPSDALYRIGAGLQTMRERYASMAMVVLSVSDHRMQVASAGMPPLLVRRHATGAVEEIMLPGVPLGTLADARYPVREVPIAAGDVVLVMSDGAAEALAPTGEHFGYDRVISHLEGCAGRTAEAIVDSLLDAVTSFVGTATLHDDVTLLALVVE